MIIKEMNILSKCDALPIYGTIMEPDGRIQGIVHICHGMAEHKERYYPFMEYLCKNGYACYIQDYRGHGKSVRSIEDLGYFYDDTATYIIEDVKQGMEMFRSRYIGYPLTLFGHSMGSLVVRKFIKYYPSMVDKLIVCGSPSKNPSVDVAIALTKSIARVKGDQYRPKLIDTMAFASYHKKFNGLNKWLSVNEENVEAYNKDELCGFMFTCNGFLNLFLLMKDVYDKNGWNLEHVDMPIFFIAGSDDPCIGNEKAWHEAMGFLKDVGYKNIEYKLYEGLRHEILLEYTKEMVFQDILDFIKK